MEPSRDIARLIEIMAALRTPVTGCPWDLEQNFETIAPYTIEEAYEVADAIARGSRADLKDELGDLLLQVVYHAQMAEEEGAFAFGDVVDAVTTKMIRRHPHVFGDVDMRTSDASESQWERIKAEERAAKVKAETHEQARASSSLLDDVPVTLPALTRAVKLQKKAAKVGFDWPSIGPVFEKMREETAELADVALAADPRGASPDLSEETKARIEEEYGDLLFVMANVARHLRIDPETALRGANAKFCRRFRHIEDRLAENNRTPADSDLAEMDALWDEARAADKQ